MLLNIPAGTTTVVDSSGNALTVINGQVDVEPHLVAGLLAAGFTVAAADSLTSDAPEFAGDTALPSE